jgi:hypothetical protein
MMKKRANAGNNFKEFISIDLSIPLLRIIANNIKKNGFCQIWNISDHKP